MLDLIHAQLTAEGQGSRPFVEGLAQTLAVQLIRQYATYDAEAQPSNALPGAKLRRATAFMEEKLHEPFDLARLAQTAGMSAFLSSRLFKDATGLSPIPLFHSPMNSQSRQLLQETHTSIIEIGTVSYTHLTLPTIYSV